ncbi:hypothetical protein DVH24_016796 [Malus domestica]|uniref:Uncharacterized protein n=1 Tax=Malus domestica TaxID=3750 RepID=A0A498HUN4_MALDO|nr:hypothetical protein DVH24_016796 [Malus domestica]
MSKKIACLAEQAWSSNRVARTLSSAPKYNNGGTVTSSDTALPRAGESMTGLLRLTTRFKLLNQWYRAELDIPEFRMLHIIMMGFDGHFYFTARPSVA